jgi:hypothetical protein
MQPVATPTELSRFRTAADFFIFEPIYTVCPFQRDSDVRDLTVHGVKSCHRTDYSGLPLYLLIRMHGEDLQIWSDFSLKYSTKFTNPIINITCLLMGSRDSSVGIATGYVLDDQGGGSSSPGRVKNFHFSILSRSALGSPSYKMGTEGSFPGVKRQGREADHSPPTSAEMKKMWIYTSTPLHVFMA